MAHPTMQECPISKAADERLNRDKESGSQRRRAAHPVHAAALLGQLDEPDSLVRHLPRLLPRGARLHLGGLALVRLGSWSSACEWRSGA